MDSLMNHNLRYDGILSKTFHLILSRFYRAPQVNYIEANRENIGRWMVGLSPDQRDHIYKMSCDPVCMQTAESSFNRLLGRAVI